MSGFFKKKKVKLAPDAVWKEDPWGHGFRFLIKSADDEGWRDYLDSIATEHPVVEHLMKGTLKAQGRMLIDQALGKSSSEQAKENAAALAQQSYSEAVEAMSVAEMKNRLGSKDVESLIPGIARVLLSDWEGVEKDDVPASATLANKLEMLGWRGWLVEATGELRDEPADGAVELTGHHRDEHGRPLLTASEPYEGVKVGLALAQWILQEAGQMAIDSSTVEVAEADAVKDTPAGDSGDSAGDQETKSSRTTASSEG